MIAVVGGVERERTERTKRLHAAPGLRHDLALLVGHGHRADGVDQDIDLDAIATAPGERARDVVGRLTFLEDVLGIVDGLPRVLDELELRGEDLVAVQEHVDPIAGHDGSLGVAGDRGGECGLADLERGQGQVRLHVSTPGEGDRQHPRARDDPEALQRSETSRVAHAASVRQVRCQRLRLRRARPKYWGNNGSRGSDVN
jgi:hypothetical protein